MLFEDIRFEPNVSVYNELDLNPDISINEQIHNLKEDLYQVEYPNGYIIDIGFYPEFKLNGRFWIQLIKDYDWTSTLFSRRTKSLKRLEKYLYDCIRIVNDLSNL